MRASLVSCVLLALVAGSQASTRILLQAQGQQQFPQFLLPPVPPQASAQVQAVLSSIGGNVNAFANAVAAANQVGGDTAVARAFADVISQGNATALLNAIATATAFGRSDISNVLQGAFARAVADQIGRGNVNQAADALAGAFTLAGGAGPALAVVGELNNIVQSVGCTGPLADTLRSASNLVTGGQNNAYAGRGQTFAYTIAQQPGVSGCWTTVGGNTAGSLLSSIQPVIVVQQGAGGAAGAAPVGAVSPQQTGLPSSAASGAATPAVTAPAGEVNVAAPGTQAPTAAGPTGPQQGMGPGGGVTQGGTGR